jgi:hypothetical protein
MCTGAYSQAQVVDVTIAAAAAAAVAAVLLSSPAQRWLWQCYYKHVRLPAVTNRLFET